MNLAHADARLLDPSQCLGSLFKLHGEMTAVIVDPQGLPQDLLVLRKVRKRLQ